MWLVRFVLNEINENFKVSERERERERAHTIYKYIVSSTYIHTVHLTKQLLRRKREVYQ